MFRWLVLVVLLGMPIGGFCEVKHLKALEALVHQVKFKDTRYVRGGEDVQWRGYSGADKSVCFADSSGLLNRLLEHCYFLTPTDFYNWMKVQRPIPKDYSEAIVREWGFERIELAYEIKPGDVIAIRRKPNANNKEGSGHIMIANSRARQIGDLTWEIEVIDCAERGHGITDSRYLGNKKYRSGLGVGTIRLVTTSAGRLVGYNWSVNPDEGEYLGPDEDRVLIAGRFLPKMLFEEILQHRPE